MTIESILAKPRGSWDPDERRFLLDWLKAVLARPVRQWKPDEKQLVLGWFEATFAKPGRLWDADEKQLVSDWLAATLARPGRSWAPEEKRLVLDWLLWQDPYDLCAGAVDFFHTKWPGLSREDGEDIFRPFLEQRLELLLGRYDPSIAELRAFLHGCLWRHCQEGASKLRRRGRREVSLSTAGMGAEASKVLDTSAEANPEERLLEQEHGRNIPKALGEAEEAVAELPPQYRTALNLHLKGKKYDEIARELGVSLQVVKNRIHRARQQLRPRLEELRTSWGV